MPLSVNRKKLPQLVWEIVDNGEPIKGLEDLRKRIDWADWYIFQAELNRIVLELLSLKKLSISEESVLIGEKTAEWTKELLNFGAPREIVIDAVTPIIKVRTQVCNIYYRSLFEHRSERERAVNWAKKTFDHLQREAKVSTDLSEIETNLFLGELSRLLLVIQVALAKPVGSPIRNEVRESEVRQRWTDLFNRHLAPERLINEAVLPVVQARMDAASSFQFHMHHISLVRANALDWVENWRRNVKKQEKVSKDGTRNGKRRGAVVRTNCA